MKKADRVFINAKVYSVLLDGSEVRGEALAVKNGKIVFIGTNKGAERYFKGAEITDCKGNSLLPSFSDARMNISQSILRFGLCDLTMTLDPTLSTPEDAVEEIKRRLIFYSKKHSELKVIRGAGFSPNWFEGELGGKIRLITKKDLDSAVSDRPVVIISDDAYSAVFNSKALEIANINKSTPEYEGGIIRRDENGEPDGYVQGSSVIMKIFHLIPFSELTIGEYKQSLLDAQKYLLKSGFTLVSDYQPYRMGYLALAELARENKLHFRINGSFHINDETRERDYDNALYEKHKWNYKDMIKVDMASFDLDGNSPYLKEPYNLEFTKASNLKEDYRGDLLWDISHFEESVNKFVKKGFNIHVSASGGEAVRLASQAIIKAQNNNKKKYEKKNLRNTISELFLADQEEMKSMGENKIIAAFLPIFSRENTITSPLYLQMLGKKRMERFNCQNSFVKNGVICSSGSYFPLNMPDALGGIETSITRKVSRNDSIYPLYRDLKFNIPLPEECISLKEAIKDWTINGAYQLHREKITGSLEVGKSADLVILNGDIESVSPSDISVLKVEETIFKGITCYKFAH